jgi:GNAT superfamily N-acetyltransferase
VTTLFGEGECVKSVRLELSTLRAAELDPMAAWIEAALAPDWSRQDLERALAMGNGVLVRDKDGKPIGAAIALAHAPAAGDACVPFLAIDPPRRFRGLGGEAGLALERHLRRRFGVGRVLAPVPDGRGLAVYFWLRLGFRPMLGREAPGPLLGLSQEPRPGIWLVRDEV